MSFLTELANKMELHIKLDTTPGYILTQEDQEVIVSALRYTDLPSETCHTCGATRLIGKP